MYWALRSRKMTIGQIAHVFRHPEKVEFFSVTDEQLIALEEGDGSMRKEMFLICTSVFFPCLVNVISIGFQSPSWPLFANGVAAGVSGILAVFFYTYWKREKSNIKEIYQRIRNQPAHVADEKLSDTPITWRAPTM